MTTEKDIPIHRLLSMADLENVTGITFKPIKKRLEGLDPVKIQGVKKIYDTKEALPLIYQIKDQSTLDLAQERAKLAKAQTQKIEIEVEKSLEKLVDVEAFMEEFQKSFISLKERLLLVGESSAQEIIGSKLKNTDEVSALIETKIHECLEEIASEYESRLK